MIEHLDGYPPPSESNKPRDLTSWRTNGVQRYAIAVSFYPITYFAYRLSSFHLHQLIRPERNRQDNRFFQSQVEDPSWDTTRFTCIFYFRPSATFLIRPIPGYAFFDHRYLRVEASLYFNSLCYRVEGEEGESEKCIDMSLTGRLGRLHHLGCLLIQDRAIQRREWLVHVTCLIGLVLMT